MTSEKYWILACVFGIVFLIGLLFIAAAYLADGEETIKPFHWVTWTISGIISVISFLMY